jgi:hypothetical protein
MEGLHLAKKIKVLKNLRKEIPEITKFIVKFQNSNEGDQAMLVYTIYLTVLRSHSVSAEGVLRPLTSAAKAGKVDCVQCVITLNEDLMEPQWLSITSKTMMGRVDKTAVEQSMREVAPKATLCELIAAAVHSVTTQ